MMPSLMVQILFGSASFLGSRNFFQPVKSLPLKSLIQPSSWPPAGLEQTAARTTTTANNPTARRELRSIVETPLQQGGNTGGILDVVTRCRQVGAVPLLRRTVFSEPGA